MYKFKGLLCLFPSSVSSAVESCSSISSDTRFSSDNSSLFLLFILKTDDVSQKAANSFSELHRPLWPPNFEHFRLRLH